MATVEAALAGTGVDIRSPDYLPDRAAGGRREVDASIRAQIGSASLLVIIECRDRHRIEDVTWLEQLATKRSNVGADKAIAVSASGFSEKARRLAETERIELRTVEQLSAGDVLEWLGVNEIVLVTPGADMQMSVEVYGDPAWERTPQWQDWEPQHLILKSPEGERLVSPAEAWDHIADEPFWSQVPPDGSRQPVGMVNVMKAPDGFDLMAETPFGLVNVRIIRFDGEVWLEQRRIPIQRATGYLGPEGVIARAHFTFDLSAQRLTVTIHKLEAEAGHIAVSVHPAG